MIRVIGVTLSTFSRLSFQVRGDGESTVLSLNMEDAPFRLDFGRNPPAIVLSASSPTKTISASTSRTVLTILFSSPFIDDADINIFFAYDGVQ